MAYTPNPTWKNGKAGGTPITADSLNHIEQGLVDVELLEGPQGPAGSAGADGADGADSTVPGPKGAKGDTGSAGADGADGFPTQSQWDDLVARVEALETPA